MTANELLYEALRIEADLLRNGDPHDGYDWAVMQLARAVILVVRPDDRPYSVSTSEDRQYAKRYRCWRSAGLGYINWDGLSSDTSDVGLDFATDRLMEEQDGN